MRKLILFLILPEIILSAAPDSSRAWRPNPTLASGLSLIIPGAGQVYNRSYWKAPIAIASEGYAVWAACDAWREMDDAEKIGRGLAEGSAEYLDAQSKWEKARDRRNIHLWLFAGLVLLSTIDAYVDAQLYPWTEEMGTPVSPPESDVVFVPSIGRDGVGIILSLRIGLP